VQITVNRSLTDRTTAGNLILLQPQPEPQAGTSFIFRMDTLSWATKFSPPVSEVCFGPLVSSDACLMMAQP
jgi:hypothetical protein